MYSIESHFNEKITGQIGTFRMVYKHKIQRKYRPIYNCFADYNYVIMVTDKKTIILTIFLIQKIRGNFTNPTFKCLLEHQNHLKLST